MLSRENYTKEHIAMLKKGGADRGKSFHLGMDYITVSKNEKNYTFETECLRVSFTGGII